MFCFKIDPSFVSLLLLRLPLSCYFPDHDLTNFFHFIQKHAVCTTLRCFDVGTFGIHVLSYFLLSAMARKDIGLYEILAHAGLALMIGRVLSWTHGSSRIVQMNMYKLST